MRATHRLLGVETDKATPPPLTTGAFKIKYLYIRKCVAHGVLSHKPPQSLGVVP
jgi:hypothetical protein